jgi:hypothetical protein
MVPGFARIAKEITAQTEDSRNRPAQGPDRPVQDRVKPSMARTCLTGTPPSATAA